MMESYIMCLYRQAEQYFSEDKSILAKCNVDETDLNSLRDLEGVAAKHILGCSMICFVNKRMKSCYEIACRFVPKKYNFFF